LSEYITTASEELCFACGCECVCVCVWLYVTQQPQRGGCPESVPTKPNLTSSCHSKTHA